MQTRRDKETHSHSACTVGTVSNSQKQSETAPVPSAAGLAWPHAGCCSAGQGHHDTSMKSHKPPHAKRARAVCMYANPSEGRGRIVRLSDSACTGGTVRTSGDSALSAGSGVAGIRPVVCIHDTSGRLLLCMQRPPQYTHKLSQTATCKACMRNIHGCKATITIKQTQPFSLHWQDSRDQASS